MRKIPPRAKPERTDYQKVVNRLKEGKLIFFLGAGANKYNRKRKELFDVGVNLPDGKELAAYLAEEFEGELGARLDNREDLARVSQHIALESGSGPLYACLRKVLACDLDVPDLYTFLATLPATMKRKGYRRSTLIVTTNYDDMLERALRNADEAFHLVTYEALERDRRPRGKFWHHFPDGERKLISPANDYKYLPEDQIVILKMHGVMIPQRPEQDSFVITEDDYLYYLSHDRTEDLLPSTLVQKMIHSAILFLGYSLRDWNMRVLLSRIWGEEPLYHSFAVQKDPDLLDIKFWAKRDVEIYNVALKTFIKELDKHVKGLRRSGDGRE